MSFNLTVPQEKRIQLRVSAFGCCHIKANRDNGYNAFEEALAQSELGEGLVPNICLSLGDYSTSQLPMDIDNTSHQDDGDDIVSELSSGTHIGRCAIYSVRGNHDAGDGDNDWFDEYIDVFGENTASSGVTLSEYPYPIIADGLNKDHYAFKTGNVLWLMLNDCNDVDTPVGRDGTIGGFPSGAISQLTWDWMQDMIDNNPNHTVICCHHNLLKDTTIATGDNEGVDGGYHGNSGQPEASGRLQNIYDRSDDSFIDSSAIIDYMDNNNGNIFMWLGSHTHHDVGETYSGRGSYISKHGTHFLNVGSLDRHHAVGADAHSRTLVFEKGSTNLEILQLVHQSDTLDEGFKRDEDLTLTLPRAFNI